MRCDFWMSYITSEWVTHEWVMSHMNNPGETRTTATHCATLQYPLHYTAPHFTAPHHRSGDTRTGWDVSRWVEIHKIYFAFKHTLWNLCRTDFSEFSKRFPTRAPSTTSPKFKMQRIFLSGSKRSRKRAISTRRIRRSLKTRVATFLARKHTRICCDRAFCKDLLFLRQRLLQCVAVLC